MTYDLHFEEGGSRRRRRRRSECVSEWRSSCYICLFLFDWLVGVPECFGYELATATTYSVAGGGIVKVSAAAKLKSCTRDR